MQLQLSHFAESYKYGYYYYEVSKDLDLYLTQRERGNSGTLTGLLKIILGFVMLGVVTCLNLT